VSLLAAGGSNGIQAGDRVVVNGTTMTGAAAEDITSYKFAVVTSNVLASMNIAATASSMMRVVNQNSAAFGAVLLDVSDASGLGGSSIPGQMLVRSLLATVDASFSCTDRPTAWSPQATVSEPARTKLNQIAFSKADQPDAVPLLNALTVGSADKAVIRIVPTRNSMFVLKEDGVWQISGYYPPFQTDPFDLTVELISPDSAVQLDNQVFCFTHHGVMRISETGATLISRPVEPPMLTLLNPANRPTTRNVSFGIADESDHKYYLFMPSAAGEQYATQAFVYDMFTDCWWRRTDAHRHGHVNSSDDRMYWADSATSSIRQERKDMTANDYADDSSPISVAIKWAPKFGQSPALLNHFREVGFLFRSIYFNAATLAFSSNVAASPVAITLSGSAYGLSPSGTPQQQIRAIVPLEQQRSSLLNVGWQQDVLQTPFQLESLYVRFTAGPERFGR